MAQSFNPCFNGTYSLTVVVFQLEVMHYSFNPCFNGTYSLTIKAENDKDGNKICFNPCFNGTYSLTIANIIRK